VRDARVKRLSTFHRVIYQATGGLLGRRLVGNDMLLLTTRGRRTGEPHTVPLLYLRDGGRLLVVASYGGRDRHPAWYLNLIADPAVTAKVGATTTPFIARTVSAPERRSWWPRVVAAYHDYAVYQERTEREIPLVFLEPAR
jgi:deazaflavin-dependent oxidoreductase (nitroreductase family)